MAAPVGGQVLSEVLPYIEADKDDEQAEEIEKVIVPKVEGKSIKEAKEILKEMGLEVILEEEVEDEDTEIVENQVPKYEIQVNKGSNVYIR